MSCREYAFSIAMSKCSLRSSNLTNRTRLHPESYAFNRQSAVTSLRRRWTLIHWTSCLFALIDPKSTDSESPRSVIVHCIKPEESSLPVFTDHLRTLLFLLDAWSRSSHKSHRDNESRDKRLEFNVQRSPPFQLWPAPHPGAIRIRRKIASVARLDITGYYIVIVN